MTTATTIGLMVTAGLLGVTHAIEPDHVAGISALTDGAGDSRLSAVVGASFAAGHVFLVVAWVAAALLLVDATAFPPILETVGLTVVGAVLVVLAAALGASAAWRLVHRHEHDHADGPHAHFHLHLPGGGHVPHGDHAHEHTVREYLKVGVVGAMFTLSPPLSMIVFVSVVLTNASVTLVVPVVLAYAVAITLTMSGIGAAAGTVFRFTRERGARAHAALQIAVAGAVLVVAVHLLRENVPALLPL